MGDKYNKDIKILENRQVVGSAIANYNSLRNYCKSCFYLQKNKISESGDNIKHENDRNNARREFNTLNSNSYIMRTNQIQKVTEEWNELCLSYRNGNCKKAVELLEREYSDFYNSIKPLLKKMEENKDNGDTREGQLLYS